MNLLHAMAVLGYLPKLEMGLGLAFGANLMHGFSMNMFLILLLDLCTNFQYHTYFTFSRYQRKCVMKLSFRQLMTSETLRIIFNHSPRQ